MRRALQLLGPVLLVVVVGLLGTRFSPTVQIYFKDALIAVAIVVGLYVFVGNSGVLSFGHMSFVAVGAWTAGVLTVPTDVKPTILPSLFPVLRDNAVGNVTSLVLAAAVGGVFALLAGLPLMRLSGLTAGIATFAVLEITHNVLRYWEQIGPGAGSFTTVPETTGLTQAVIGALVVTVIAFVYQLSPPGRMLRATREDAFAAQAAGVSVYRQRLLAFTLSGALCGLAGGLLIHSLTITSEEVYLDLTFLTLAMLVIGGSTSLWGAVLGALVVTGIDSFLSEAEVGIDLGFQLDLPTGTRLVVVGALMALVLIFRPSGLTGGKELV
jgi:branched-chain amino acid transport system permease protein